MHCERQVATGSAKSRRARESRYQAAGIAVDSSHAKKSCSARATFRGAKPIIRVMDDDERSNLAGRLRKAAEKMPYPYFLLRLEDIEAWLKAGYSVKGVWRIYCEKSVPFPGSYRSFLRYCNAHALGRRRAKEGTQPEPPSQRSGVAHAATQRDPVETGTVDGSQARGQCLWPAEEDLPAATRPAARAHARTNRPDDGP